MKYKCPVCNTEYSQNVIKCEVCKFTNKFGIDQPWPIAEDAEKWLNTVVKPYRMEWLSRLISQAASLMAEKQYDEFINHITEIIGLNPDVPLAFYLRATASEEIGRYDDAIRDYTESIRLLELRAVYYREGGLLVQDKTNEDFSNAFPGYRWYYQDIKFARACAYYKNGQYDEAINGFSDEIDEIKENPDIYLLRGRAYSNKDLFNEAIKDFTEAIRLDPDHASDAYCDRGHAYRQKGDIDRAIADFNEAIRLNPNNAEAFKNRGYAYLQKGDFDRAIADFNAAIRLDPNDGIVYFYRGNAYQQKGDIDRAIADFGEVIKIYPDVANAYNQRGIAYAERGDYAQGIADLEVGLRIEPNNATIKQNLDMVRKEQMYGQH